MKMRNVLVAILLLGASGAAVAGHDDSGMGSRDFHDGWVQQRESRDATTTQAPEIDPASLIAAMTLLGGGLIVMRGRRASKSPV
jgi:hypothetical protein